MIPTFSGCLSQSDLLKFFAESNGTPWKSNETIFVLMPFGLFEALVCCLRWLLYKKKMGRGSNWSWTGLASLLGTAMGVLFINPDTSMRTQGQYVFKGFIILLTFVFHNLVSILVYLHVIETREWLQTNRALMIYMFCVYQCMSLKVEYSRKLFSTDMTSPALYFIRWPNMSSNCVPKDEIFVANITVRNRGVLSLSHAPEYRCLRLYLELLFMFPERWIIKAISFKKNH